MTSSSPDRRAPHLHPHTVAVTAGRPDRVVDAPLNPPVVFASTYIGSHDTTGDVLSYGRYGNPTWAALEEAIGAPYAVVHNAGISAAGMAEETPMTLWERMFETSVFGPVALTNALLPAMRDAGRGRIVVVSSAGGVRGMPATAPYSAAKGASERWAESLAGEIAPFGLGVTVLVTGTYDTDIITDAGTTDSRDFEGPYRRHHATMDKRGRLAMKYGAKSPDRFAAGLAKALEGTKPFARRPVGADARMLLTMNRVLPAAGLHQVIRVMMGLPRHGAIKSHESDDNG